MMDKPIGELHGPLLHVIEEGKRGEIFGIPICVCEGLPENVAVIVDTINRKPIKILHFDAPSKVIEQ